MSKKKRTFPNCGSFGSNREPSSDFDLVKPSGFHSRTHTVHCVAALRFILKFEPEHSIFSTSLLVRPFEQCSQNLNCPPEDILDPLLPIERLRKFWLHSADVLAGPSIRWAHMQSCRKCCDPASLLLI